jgi:small-conductance mechanosensitive channel
VAIVVALCSSFLFPHSVVGQAAAPPSPTAATVAEVETAIKARRARVAEELLQAGSAAPTSDSEATAILERIDLQLAQQLDALRRRAELEASQEALRKEQEAWSPGSQAAPSLLALDQARNELAAARRREKGLEERLPEAEAALEQARDEFDTKERLRREARDFLSAPAEGTDLAQAERSLTLRRLESRAAAEEVGVREMELRNERLARRTTRERVAVLENRIARFPARLLLSRDELQDQLVRLQTQEGKLKQALEGAKLDLRTAEQQWARVQQQFESVSTPSSSLGEEVEARRLSRQTAQLAVTLLGQRLQRIEDLAEVWKRRFEMARGDVPRGQLSTWHEEASQAAERLQRDLRVYEARREELRGTLQEAAADADTSKKDGGAARWRREQRRHLEDRVRLYDTAVDSAAATHEVYRNLLLDLDARLATVPWSERLLGVWEAFASAWGYELFTIDDASITPAKIVQGLVLLGLGLLAATYASRQFGQRLLPRFGLDMGAIAALQSLVFYALAAGVALMALRIVNVPLTAFTLLGGAAAIGIGFGSQNIVNNFISGLILLTERPIRVGDLIEVDGTYGTVEQIGARSTRILSSTNIDIIVPNSSFLEKNVVNWTRSSDRARTHVSVGVVYGSPVDEVTRLIGKAVGEHEKIFTFPKPIILFSDFGDNALIFEVHFWVQVRRLMDRRVIESELRYRLDALFREAGIVIAFPQRDVHLDSVRPVEVRLVEPREGSKDG